MIKNIVFDMGQVLIRFDTDIFMDRIGVAPEDKPVSALTEADGLCVGFYEL